MQRVFAGWVLIASSLPLTAQDYQRFQPKLPQGIDTTPTLPESPLPAASGDSTVLINHLKGVVFVTDPSQITPTPPKVVGIETGGIAILQNKDFPPLIQPYLGRPVTMDRLNALIKEVILFSRNHDRPVVDIIVPKQEITSGVIQLIFMEGKLGEVKAEGNHWVSSAGLVGDVSLKEGEPVSARQLLGDISWINQNPFVTTEAIFTPGEKLGFTNVVLETKDRFPVRPYIGYENNGNPATGSDRYEAGFNWGDAFQLGLGQQLNYQYTTSGDGNSLQAHAASYVIPLPWHHTLTFFGSYTETHGVVPPFLGIDGSSYQISARYSVPLPTLKTADSKLSYKQDIGTGFDYKYNNNALEFGGLPAGGTLYDVAQFVVNYSGVETDPYGETSLDDQFYVSPGDWGDHNDDASFTGAHTLATADYVYNTLTLERLTRLPGDWSLILRGTLQNSDGNLVPSEQLGFGGYETVRGYDEREVNTDEGFIFNTELRTPAISFGDLLGFRAVHDQLQFLGFWDYGAAHNHTLLPGESYETPLSSVGAGLCYSINTYLSVRFDYGFQLLSTGFDNDHASRADVGVVLSY